jgi:dihydropteroate synthase
MGVINVTPDSFSDGGVHLRTEAAVAAAWAMLDDGAAIVDVGGESTRPGSEGVQVDEELARVVPVLERLAFAVDAGIAEERICLDPGIGFGKTVDQNFELIARLDVLLALGRPVLVGFSRKSSLGRLLGDPRATTGTTAASVGAAVAAYDRGATILRAHDVREHVEALTVAAAIV